MNQEVAQRDSSDFEVVPSHLTPADVEGVVVGEAYHVFPDTTLTVCCLTLRNGARVIGHNYGAICLARQDWEMGRRKAKAMAMEKIWELEGYLLRQKQGVVLSASATRPATL